MSRLPRIFLSYSYTDEQQAITIINEFNANGLEVIGDKSDYSFGEIVGEKVSNSLEKGDVFVLLLSSHLRRSKWFLYELESFINKKLNPRDIMVIPVILSSVKTPEFLSHLVNFNMKRNFQTELRNLVFYLKQIRYIDFEFLDYSQFEQLIFRLLKRLKFRNISTISSKIDYGYDFEAVSKHKDPFGNYVELKWIISVKFYKQSRADITSLRQISQIIDSSPSEYNGVIITNGQLTSSAKDWLNNNNIKSKINITIIDGIKLKQLILRYPDLVNEFFGYRGE